MSLRRTFSVYSIMSKQVLTVQSQEPVSKAVAKLMGFNVGSIIVLDDKNGNLLGIITKGDVLRKVVLRGINPLTTPSKNVMSSPVITIRSTATIEEASKLMNEKKISKLAVVDEGRLVGIITSTDIIQVEPALITYLTDLIKAKSVPALDKSRQFEFY
jgi:CBS domain-containing protein